jgi:hypothetical protein
MVEMKQKAMRVHSNATVYDAQFRYRKPSSGLVPRSVTSSIRHRTVTPSDPIQLTFVTHSASRSTDEAQIRTRATSLGIFDGQSGTGTGISPSVTFSHSSATLNDLNIEHHLQLQHSYSLLRSSSINHSTGVSPIQLLNIQRACHSGGVFATVTTCDHLTCEERNPTRNFCRILVHAV